jgi:hypothetical protein
MAKGRMLKKKISKSRKLAALPSDSDRMFYTWLIPHLDVEGRILADPDCLKGQIVPRIKSWTAEKVQETLHNLAQFQLILLYRADGDQYLELIRFKNEQALKEEREAKSECPAPIKSGSTQEYSGVNPDNSGLNQDQLRSTPAQANISKDNIRQVKDSFSKEKQAKPAHSSKHFTENINKEFLKPLLDIAKQIQGKSNGKKAFNFYQWIQQHTRRGSHPGAMIKAGQSLLDYWQTVKDPRRYLEGIMKTENQNYHERDYIAGYQVLKAEMKAWEKTPEAKKIGQLLNLKHLEAL